MEIIRQKEVGDKIIDLIKKEVGKSFTSKYQGDPNGKVAILVITGSNPKFVGRIKTYIWNGFHTILSKINGHGGGIDTTIVINLAEQSDEIFSNINLRHKSVYPNGTKKSNRHLPKEISKVEVELQEDKIEVEASNLELSDDDLSMIKKCRYSISLLLKSVYSFEKRFDSSIGDYKTFFSFENSNDLEMQVVHCKDEFIAKKIEMAIKSFIGDPDSTSLDKNEILVNFTKMKERGKNSTNGSYVLPPNENSTGEEVYLRLCRVSYWAKPIVKNNGGNFTASYPRLTTAQKIYQEIYQMGWRVKMDEDGLIHVIVRMCNSSKNSVPEEKKEKITEEIVPKSNSFFAKNLFTQKEAIEQFEKMFYDGDTWSKISDVRKPKIIAILKDDLRKRTDKEEFALILLSHAPKSLFTKEETIVELQFIFKSPDFLNLSDLVKEHIRSRLKEGLIDLNPDDLAGDLLDLF